MSKDIFGDIQICYWIVYFFKGKGTLIATVIMNVHLFLVATYVIILGTSDGISVVWIVLSPPVCVLLIGLKYGSISAFAIIAELIFFFWTPFGNELVKYDYHSGFKIIFPMVIIVLYTFTFFFEFMREITIKALHREMSRIEEVYKYHHKELEGRIQETRSERHDMRQYLLVLTSLIEGGKSDSIYRREDGIGGKSSMITYCEHFGINAVMTYFDARAKEYGIKTDIKLSYPEKCISVRRILQLYLQISLKMHSMRADTVLNTTKLLNRIFRLKEFMITDRLLHT